MTLEGRVCVVTGASSGIGRSLALALGHEGAHVWALGRDAGRLAAVAAEGGERITVLSADLSDEVALEKAAREIVAAGRVDVLVHSAGVIARGPLESADVADLDSLYHVTLRGPFLLTRWLLPALREAAGRIVFVNSLVSRGGSNDAVLYAAMKQAAKELADGLRQELNAEGVRVMTVSPGRTDTPMQAWVHDHEDREYRPELLLGAEDVASLVVSLLAVGPRGEVTDVSLRPMTKLEPRRS